MTKLLKACWKYGMAVAVVSTAASSSAVAQHRTPELPRDVALTYTADRTNPVAGPNQWLMGGSAEAGANVVRGFGLEARVTGVTTDSIGSQGVPLSLVLATFGPRYRFHVSRWSFYGEGLVGEANAVQGSFPTTGQGTARTFALALQVGGGVDVQISKHFSLRAADANWTRTEFSNTTTDVQNHLLLGAGPVLRF